MWCHVILSVIVLCDTDMDMDNTCVCGYIGVMLLVT